MEVVQRDKTATIPAEKVSNNNDSSVVDFFILVIPPTSFQIPDSNYNNNNEEECSNTLVEKMLEYQDASKVDDLLENSGRNDNVGDKTGETVNAYNKPI